MPNNLQKLMDHILTIVMMMMMMMMMMIIVTVMLITMYNLCADWST